jgi:hypothetical protein
MRSSILIDDMAQVDDDDDVDDDGSDGEPGESLIAQSISFQVVESFGWSSPDLNLRKLP